MRGLFTGSTLTVLAALTLTACQDRDTTSGVAANVAQDVARTVAKQVSQHRDITRRVFEEVLNQGRFELFDTHYDPAFRKHVDGRTFTLAEERQQAQGTRAIASDLVMTIETLVAEGDYVAVRYRGTGTNDGPFGGYPPSGKRIDAHGMTINRFANGRIVEEWTTYNALDLLMQLGHFPPAP